MKKTDSLWGDALLIHALSLTFSFAVKDSGENTITTFSGTQISAGVYSNVQHIRSHPYKLQKKSKLYA